MNIKLLLAFQNKDYVDRLNFAISSDNRFTLSVFTDKEKMVQVLKSKKYDVAIFDSHMYDRALNSVPLKIQSCDPDMQFQNIQDCLTINMYQNAEKTLRFVIEQYAELAPEGVSFSSDKMAVYTVCSANGGAGKTIVALAVTKQLNLQGQKAVYISLEPFSSLATFIGATPEKGLSEIFGKLDSQINFTAKMESLLRKENDILYFDGFDNPKDAEEVTVDDLLKFIAKVENSGLFNAVVFDTQSSISKLNQTLFQKSDKLLLVCDKTQISIDKTQHLLNKTDFLYSYEDKIQLIANRNSAIKTSLPTVKTNDLGSTAEKDKLNTLVASGELRIN